MAKIKVRNNLKQILEEKGVSGYALEKLTGIKNQTIYVAMMRESYDPRMSTAIKVSSALGLRPDDIWKIN